MRDNFYDSPVWKRKRARILRRDGYMCVECRKYHRTDRDGNPVRATTVHHIVHREDDPSLSLVDSNLVSLCEACHNKQHPEKGLTPPPSRKRY
jgi:5-methylcytosine-specific restriction enzyme A